MCQLLIFFLYPKVFSIFLILYIFILLYFTPFSYVFQCGRRNFFWCLGRWPFRRWEPILESVQPVCVGEFWGIELCLLAYVGWWCDASVCSWELCMACYEVEGCGIIFSLSSLHTFILSHFQRRLQLSILTFLTPTKTSTAFLCPPKLNSTLMIQCFLPLPHLGAAAASQARRTGWGVGMAYRAGGDLAGLLHTAAIANYLIWPQRSHYSLQLRQVLVCRQKGRSCCWDVRLWPDLCKHQQNQLPSFRTLCNEDFFI